MEEEQKSASLKMEATALDVEFIPYTLIHKVHRNLKSSQVEIVQMPYYLREPTPESEPELPTEQEPEIPPPAVVFAPPLPALKEKKNWWDFTKPIYAFNHPVVRDRMEQFMETMIVYITDRRYMVKLQEKIKESHLDNLEKRIQKREAEEVKRQKVLLLEGKMSFEDAPKELKSHPVCRINQLAKKIMEEKTRRAKAKTTAYKTSARRIRMAEKALKDTAFDKLQDERSDELSQSACVVDAEPEEDVAEGFMFSQEDYDKLKYEDPLVKLLREIEIVNDMYELADRIVGPTKVDTGKK